MAFTSDLTGVYSDNTPMFAEYMAFYIQRMCDNDAEYMSSAIALGALYACRRIINEEPQDVESLRSLCSIMDNSIIGCSSKNFFEEFCGYFMFMIGDRDDEIQMDEIRTAYESGCSPRIFYMAEMCIDMLHMNFNPEQEWMNEQFHSFELERRVMKEIANGYYSADYRSALLKEAKTPAFDGSLILMMVKAVLHAYNQVVECHRCVVTGQVPPEEQ